MVADLRRQSPDEAAQYPCSDGSKQATRKRRLQLIADAGEQALDKIRLVVIARGDRRLRIEAAAAGALDASSDVPKTSVQGRRHRRNNVGPVNQTECAVSKHRI